MLENEVTQVDRVPSPFQSGTRVPRFVFKDFLGSPDKPSATNRALQFVVLWRDTILSAAHYLKPQEVHLGTSKKNEHWVPQGWLPYEPFVVASGRGVDWVVHCPEDAAIEVCGTDGRVRGQVELLQQNLLKREVHQGVVTYDYSLGLTDRVALQIHDLTYVFEYITPTEVVAPKFLNVVDGYFLTILFLTLLAASSFVAALFWGAPQADRRDDATKNADRVVQLLFQDPKKFVDQRKQQNLEGKSGGGRHKGQEGKFGKPDADKVDAAPSVKGAPQVDSKKRERDRRVAMSSGIFAALNSSKVGSAASNVLGPGGLGTGINDALGGLRGSGSGDALGVGGMGSRGTGAGGGGQSLGVGGLGDGRGRGTGGLGDVDLGGRAKGKYEVAVGRDIVTGCLSREVVGRVVSRAQSQAKYCYEKELTASPDLSGKVVTVFTIDGSGSVVDARVGESTINNPGMEDCLLRVIQRLKFPPCQGGGTAEITYPWIFKAAGN